MKATVMTMIGAAGVLGLLAGFEARAAEESSAFQRDREAILGMVGTFRVEFNFQESVALEEGYELRKPYHEEALELVKLVEDRGKLIVLQHILLADDGLEVHVVKHWGQIWKYEDPTVLEYAGGKEWRKRELAPEEVAGCWTQCVTQTDDSPRYESWGRWEHLGNRSAWQSQVTNRPLPRREYTKRSDYDILVAVNRHVLTPEGWVHEQDNRKWDSAGQRFLCHETGLNRYTRCTEDMSAAEAQWEKTKDFWRKVRMEWAERIGAEEVIAYAAKVEGKSLIGQTNALARRVEKGETLESGAVENLLDTFLVKP